MSEEGDEAKGPAGERRAWSEVRARVVTYGLVVGLLLGAWTHTEQWPVTSFRLFSSVRTDRSFRLELVAVKVDGSRERMSLGAGDRVIANAAHQLVELRSEPVARGRARVLAWMDLTGLDPDDYRAVNLERVERRLDPDGGPSTEVNRTVVRAFEL